MKNLQKKSNRFTTLKLFMDALKDGVKAKIITAIGIGVVFGAAALFGHAFHKSSPANPIITEDSAIADTDSDLNGSKSGSSRAPASIENANSKKESSATGNSNQSNYVQGNSQGNDTRTQGTTSQNDNFNGAGKRPSQNFARGNNFSQDSQNPSADPKDATKPNSDSNTSIGGAFPAPTSAPGFASGSTGGNSGNQNGTSTSSSPAGTALSTASAFSISSGGGIMQTPHLMVQAQIGEVTSRNVLPGTTLTVIAGLSGALY